MLLTPHYALASHSENTVKHEASNGEDPLHSDNQPDLQKRDSTDFITQILSGDSEKDPSKAAPDSKIQQSEPENDNANRETVAVHSQEINLDNIRHVLPASATPPQMAAHLKNRFQALKKPRPSFLFFKTIRLKKYTNTKKDLRLFYQYVDSLEQKTKERNIHEKSLYEIYLGLWDKISWINDFNDFAPVTFNSTFKANQTFKANSNYFHDKLKIIKTGK